jgi:hypothetical protein
MYTVERWNKFSLRVGGKQQRSSILLALLLFLTMVTWNMGSGTIPTVQGEQRLEQVRRPILSSSEADEVVAYPTQRRYLKDQNDARHNFMNTQIWSSVWHLFQRKCPTRPKVPALPGKKGAAFTLREEGQPGSWVVNLPKVTQLRPYWNYSWGPQRIQQQPNNIEFVPMIWGGNNADHVKDVVSTYIAPEIKNGNVKRVLGFNEPDSNVQSNMNVSIALDRWKEFEALNVPLVSPSCAHPDQEWMKSFMKSADRKCKRIDWVGVHWYGTDFKSFKSAMTKYHDLYDRPILVTEFALADWTAKKVSDNKISKADTLKFMKEALYWLETQSWIVGYAWFSFEATHPAGTNSALYNETGTLTTLGKFYASVRTNRPRGDRSII